MKPQKKTITVGFFSPVNDEETGCFSWLASKVTSANGELYSHVELRFSNGMVTSVTREPGHVHYEERLLSNSGYRSFFEIDVDPSVEEIIQEYAQKCASKKIPFNAIGMYWNFLPLCGRWAVHREGTAFFCSEYIATLLQMAYFCPELDPATSSPTDIWISLKNDARAQITFNKVLYYKNKSEKGVA